MKTKGKRKFFKCLEPLGANDGPGTPKRSSLDGAETDRYSLGSGKGFVGGGGGGGDIARLSKILPSPLNVRKFESSNGDFARDRPGKSRRSFSRAIKAVFFETSLTKKFRKKWASPSTSIRSTGTNLQTETENLLNEKSLSKESCGADEFPGSDSSDTSLFSSSTTTSSSCTSSNSASERKISSPSVCCVEPPIQTTSNERFKTGETSCFNSKEPHVLKQKKPVTVTAVKEPLALRQARTVTALSKRYNLNIMCFVVLSLMALVFWGKVLAIVCTSTWLYFVPRSFDWVAADLPEIYSDELYGNKVVDERVSESNLSRWLCYS